MLLPAVAVGFETLRANPLRTLLSTLGIVMGVAALVAVLSVGDGMERFAREQIERTSDLQRLGLVARTTRSIDGQPFPIADPVRFTAADIDSLGQALGAAASVNLSVSRPAILTLPADTVQRAAMLTGLLRPDLPLTDSALVAGRLFTVDEGARGADVVILSQGLATAIRAGDDLESVLGDTVLLGGSPRVVIGVLGTPPQLDRGSARMAFLPLGALPPALATPFDRPASASVKATRIEDVPAVRAATERWLASRYGAEWKDKVTISSNEARMEQTRQAILMFRVFMGALMSISLLVGGIGIMNVLLASVIERTREIGIRKAAGARHRHILWQFLSESVAITGLGSVIGIILGVSGAFLVTFVMRRVTEAPIHAWISVSTVAVALGASVVVGLTFGLYPALRAARLSPIEAIHHE